MRVFAGVLLAAILLIAGCSTEQGPGEVKREIVHMTVKTGRVAIQLRPDLAPKHIERIKKLIAEKFYDGIIFHRVIDGFMAQTGDPTGTGAGGSKYADLPAEFTKTPFKRGTIGAARTNDPNSANSQFFICYTDTSCAHLIGQYTVWGRVVEGMEHIDAIKQGGGETDKIITMRLAK